MNGRPAVVLGASRGIGRAAARALAAEGWPVAVVARDAASCADVVAEIEAAGGSVTAHAADVTDYRAMSALAEAIGPAGALFHNAGKIIGAGPLMAIDPADWQSCFALNLSGPLHSLRAFAPAMAAAGGGAIVVNTARSGIRGIAGLGLYSAAKAAATMLAVVAAQELGPQGVRVNVIAPGFIASEAWTAMLGGQADALAAGVPLRRIGTPDEVGALVAWLLGPQSSYVSGAVIPVDGGG